MNEIQSVTVFAPFQDKSYVLSLDKLCNDRLTLQGKRRCRGNWEGLASVPDCWASKAAVKHLLSSYCVRAKASPG